MAGAPGRRGNAERVLDFLRAAERPLSAYQILEGLRPEGFAAPTTVYRALAQLEAGRRVHRIESLNAWTPCCDPAHAEAAVFEICESCGAVAERLDARLARDVAALAARTGFAPDRPVIEIRGRCGACRAAPFPA